jgi:hypothetical protein
MKGDSVPYHSELKKYQRNSGIEKISSLGMAIVCEIGLQKTRGIEEYLFEMHGR